jgi:8-oxo-dGTP pyrophosphatase MutT (NUDIX family)
VKRRLANWIRRSSLLRWGLWLGVQLFIPRQHVGVVGALFNETGQVLLVEHVFRPYFPWGLPGGWIGRGEDPARAVEREYQEELDLQIEVGTPLLCQPQGGWIGVPPGLGLAYYCRLKNIESSRVELAAARDGYELLAVKWVEPNAIEWELTPIDRRAIELGRHVFEQEQQENRTRKD